MHRDRASKVVGATLLLSGLALAMFKAAEVAAFVDGVQAWALPDDGEAWLWGLLLFELVLLVARVALGILLYRRIPLAAGVFYSLAELVALSGLSGLVLGSLACAVRLWPRGRAGSAHAGDHRVFKCRSRSRAHVAPASPSALMIWQPPCASIERAWGFPPKASSDANSSSVPSRSSICSPACV